MISPHHYPELPAYVGDGNDWNWDGDTKVRAQGLKASLSSFQTIAAFIITKKVLDEVKSIASKLQRREQDIFESYRMVTSVINNTERTQSDIDTVFISTFLQALMLTPSQIFISYYL